MHDQFAFRPTGCTTAALVQLLHDISSMFEQGNDYVRCLMIDYSKAFDTVNHLAILTELTTMNLHQSVFSWIADFLTERKQAVKIGNQICDFLPITRSIVQGSGLGPYLYITLAKTLKTYSKANKLIKYADDKSVLVPQHSDCTIEMEYQNIVNWFKNIKLNLNVKKTKEIIFWKNKQLLKNITFPRYVTSKELTQ